MSDSKELVKSKDEMFTIQEFISETKYNIDNFIIDKFWNNMSNDMDIYIDDSIIRWMGYTGQIRIAKQKFNKLLENFTENNEYQILNNEEYENFSCILKDTRNNIYPKVDRSHGKNNTKHILLKPDTFREIMMMLRTKKANDIRKYYLSLEKLIKLYSKYQTTYKETIINKQIEESKQKHKEELAQEKKKNMELTNFVENAKAKEKNQIFYIVTTNQYTARNKYKIGGIEHRTSLKSNLNSYNRGECEGNKHYYIYIKECYDYRTVERLLKGAIPVFFKDNKNARNEMFHCHYSIIKEIVDVAIDNANKFVDHVGGLITEMIRLTSHEKPMSPKPIELSKKITLTITENGEEKVETFDWETLTNEEILVGIKNCINSYAKDHGQEWNYDIDKDSKELQIIWKDLQKYMMEQFHILKHNFKAKHWKKKMTQIDNEAKQLNIIWISRKKNIKRKSKESIKRKNKESI